MKYAVFGLAAIVATVAASEAPAVQKRAPPVLKFECKDYPNICKTQCYGAYCAGNGDTLVFDNPSLQEKRNRRKDAGCLKSGGNRCSKKNSKKDGQQCDEYPFASSKPKGTTLRLNKCVPAKENQSQGGKLSKFYQDKCKNNNNCEFKLDMAGGGALCDQKDKDHQTECNKEKANIEAPGAQPDAGPGDISDDGSDDNEAKRSVGRVMRRYLTSAGREIELRDDYEVGRTVMEIVPRNETLHEEQLDNAAFDEDDEDDFSDMLDNLEIREETIVKALN